jgi:hypothetical protein
LDLDILSLDVYANGEVFASYAKSIRNFLDKGGILAWGIVPTNFEPFEKENLDSLETQLESNWSVLDKKGIDREFLISRSLLAPATCCLVNPDREKIVEKAYAMIKALSKRLRDKYRMS